MSVYASLNAKTREQGECVYGGRAFDAGRGDCVGDVFGEGGSVIGHGPGTGVPPKHVEQESGAKFADGGWIVVQGGWLVAKFVKSRINKYLGSNRQLTLYSRTETCLWMGDSKTIIGSSSSLGSILTSASSS